MSFAIPNIGGLHLGHDLKAVLIERLDRFCIRPATDGAGRLFEIGTERQPGNNINDNKKERHDQHDLPVFFLAKSIFYFCEHLSFKFLIIGITPGI